jgi:hypothetical protein
VTDLSRARVGSPAADPVDPAAVARRFGDILAAHIERP